MPGLMPIVRFQSCRSGSAATHDIRLRTMVAAEPLLQKSANPIENEETTMNTKATVADAQLTHSSDSALHDFDFLYGHWRVEHRKLKSQLTGCSDWENFASTQECLPLIGGVCNVDESRRIDAAPGEGHIGASLRCFNLQTRQWSIFWVGARDGVLTPPPVVGGFRDGIGHFDADEVIDGRLVRVRFTWSGISATTAHWQQGFSLDEGKTWEINWTMAFARITAGEYAALQGGR